jgi:CRISPR/Cas system-associated exonuclease Cas4 (RecB family)
MNLPTNFRFSQSNLQDYLLCPKRFKLRHLQQISWPAQETQYDRENELHQQLGTRFHLLIQRHLTGLPQAEITQNIADPILLQWWQNFTHSFGDKFTSGDIFPEFSLVGKIDTSPTVAKFDLIHIEDQHLTIYDWKTNQKAPRRQNFEDKIQTRLYLYLLSKFGTILTEEPIAPENISMTYWFAEHPFQTQTFTYSEELQRSDEIFLTDLIQSIKQTPEENFFETPNKKLCRFCPFRSYCEKPNITGTLDELEQEFELDQDDFNIDLSFDDLDEVLYG